MKTAKSADSPGSSPTPGNDGMKTAKSAGSHGRLDRVLTVLCVVFGAFTLLVFGAYFVKITIFPEGTLPVVACLLVFAWLAIPLVFRKALRRGLKKLWLPAKAIYAAILVAFTVSFVAMSVYVLSPRDETPYDELPENPVVVVFGAKVNANGSPGTPLARRLHKAKDILDARPDAICIVSGGKGDDEPISEAQSMKSWLVSAGIDESRIILEERSRNTLQNVKYTSELIDEKGLSDSAICCVSSDFHIPRIEFIGKNKDFGDYFYSGEGRTKWDVLGLVREYLSFGRLLLLGFDS